MTAVEWYDQALRKCLMGTVKCDPNQIFEEAKQMEEQRLRDAIMYALDEDGHTGDWKIKFTNDYINSLKQKK